MADVAVTSSSTRPLRERRARSPAPKASAGRWRARSFVAAFLENRLASSALGIIVAVAAFCFLGPLVYHSDQVHANIALTNLAPGAGHPLGTDANGFDILGRLMVGGQSALEISLAVALVATSFGALWGAVVRLHGRRARRRHDAHRRRRDRRARHLPAHLPGERVPARRSPLLIVVLSLLSWLGPARLVRGETLSLRTREFVDAVRAAGGRTRASSGVTSSRTRSGRSRSTPPSRWPTPSSSSPP